MRLRVAFNITGILVQSVDWKNERKPPCDFSRLNPDCQVDRRIANALLFLVFFPLALFAQPTDFFPKAPLGLVWEADLAPATDYSKEVEALLASYEAKVKRKLGPLGRGKVGLKVNTRGGAGLSTPAGLVRALVTALERRGYGRDSIYIVDYSAHNLRAAGFLPPLSDSGDHFEGVRVIALASNKFYDPDWFYDSPLPPAYQQEPRLMLEGAEERKSFLAMPLLFEVDMRINLAVGVDDPALGVDGLLANATLWNVSNSRRFLVNQATASAAVAEIAAIPELAERLVLHFVSLETYQFIAGPFFNALYTRSEPRLWMSSDPVALDRLLYERINAARRLEGFPEVDPLPRQLPFAASLGLGIHERFRIRIESLGLDHPEPPAAEEPREPPRFEEPPSWLRRITPW